MRNTILTISTFLLFMFFLSEALFAQIDEDDYSDISKYVYSDISEYRTKNVPSDYNDEERFKKESDKNDFKKLREYRREKEDLIDALRSELNAIPDESRSLKFHKSSVDELSKLIIGKKSNEKVDIKWNLIEYFPINKPYTRAQLYANIENEFDKIENTRTVDEVKDVISKIQEKIKEIEAQTVIHEQIKNNLKTVKQDLYLCVSQIDSALAPEYKKQEFRKDISLYFTILIGILLFIFFFIVYKKSDKNLSKELLSGNGLQFITLFVLIIAIILFGILSILQGSELAAILSGISGYILGKGVAIPKMEKDKASLVNPAIAKPPQNPSN